MVATSVKWARLWLLGHIDCFRHNWLPITKGIYVALSLIAIKGHWLFIVGLHCSKWSMGCVIKIWYSTLSYCNPWVNCWCSHVENILALHVCRMESVDRLRKVFKLHWVGSLFFTHGKQGVKRVIEWECCWSITLETNWWLPDIAAN